MLSVVLCSAAVRYRDFSEAVFDWKFFFFYFLLPSIFLLCPFLFNFSLLTCICLNAGVNLLAPSGHCQIRDVITTGIDMCGRRMRKGGGWTVRPSRRWLISCARAAVLYVCLSIALTSCTTSMAETNLDAIRKQKNAEYSKRYRLKQKMQMQQQAPTTSEAEPEKLQV